MAGFNEEMTNLKSNLQISLKSKSLSPVDVLACVTAISNYLQKQKVPVALVREHTLEIVENIFDELFASDQTVPDLLRPLLPAAIDAGLNLSSRCFAWAFSFFSRLVKSRVALTKPAVVAGAAQAEEVHLAPQGATAPAQLVGEVVKALEPVKVVEALKLLEVVEALEPVKVVEVVKAVEALEPVGVVEAVKVLKPVDVPAVFPSKVSQSDLD